MPIHAAGVYNDQSSIGVSDFFVSSYTPTLEALLEARERPVLSGLKVLAAAQPNPGKGYSRLPSVKAELQEIVDVVPRENLLLLGDCTLPDFEGHHTTIKNVLRKLPEANVLHLACHGNQDVKHPLDSGFILANGEKLTVQDLVKCRLPNAHTAILSACHTASNDVKQPDEAVNLANTLLALGFSSILATKW